MASFEIAKNFTRDLEGGFWNDPSAGYTYAGITARYYPSWPGFAILRQLGKIYFGSITRIPRYTIFHNAALDKAVHDFYYNRHWKTLVKGQQIANQTIANIVYDFIVHKENAAINVINQVAKTIVPPVLTKRDQLTTQVTGIFNRLPATAYRKIRAARIRYYQTAPFSKKFKKEFIDRVYKFPVSIPATLSEGALLFSFKNFQNQWN